MKRRGKEGALPVLRPRSYGLAAIQDAQTVRESGHIINMAADDIIGHDADSYRRLAKGIDDLDNNETFVTHKFRSQLKFLRDGLDRIGGSAVEQRLLAEHLQELIELDDDVSKRYRC